MPHTVALKTEAMRSLAHGSFAGTYTNVGTALPDYTKAIVLYNGTDEVVQFSLDAGTTDFVPLPAGQVLYLDLKALDLHAMASAHRIAVKDVGTPTTGSVYVGVIL